MPITRPSLGRRSRSITTASGGSAPMALSSGGPVGATVSTASASPRMLVSLSPSSFAQLISTTRIADILTPEPSGRAGSSCLAPGRRPCEPVLWTTVNQPRPMVEPRPSRRDASWCLAPGRGPQPRRSDGEDGSREASGASGAVAFLVLLAGAAGARVVPADLLPLRRDLRLLGRHGGGTARDRARLSAGHRRRACGS